MRYYQIDYSAGEDYCFKYERGNMWVFSHNLNFMSEISKRK